MLALLNATIWPAAGPKLERGTVIIDGRQIVAVGHDPEIPANALRLDCRGRHIIPGLIDGGSRLGIHEDGNGPIGHDEDEIGSNEAPYLRAADAFWPEDLAVTDAYRAGVTTVLVEPGNQNTIGGLAAMVKTYGSHVDDLVISHEAALKVSLTGQIGRSYSDFRERPEDIARLRARLEQFSRSPKEEAADTRDLGREVWSRVLRRELPLLVHVYREFDIANALQLAAEWGLRLILEDAPEAHLAADILAEAGVPVVVGPLMVPRFGERKWLSLRTPAVLAQKGVEFAITTGHPTIPIRYLLTQPATAVGEGLDEEVALRSVTLAPARIFGVSDRIGSLEPGKDADLVVLSGPPFAATSYVTAVYINGACIYEQKQSPIGERSWGGA
ncbi:MAG: amidohydrolase family protein [Bacillota bacterium]